MRMLSKFILASFLCLATASADEEKTHDITLQIHINCPESEEFMDFVKTVPEPGHHAKDFEEWKESFIANMTRIIALVESEQVNNCSWGVNTEVHVPQDDTNEIQE